MYTKVSKPVYLSSGIAYLVDVCLIVGDFGAIQVSWKKPNTDAFTKIDENVLSPLFNNTSKIVTLPNIMYENFSNDALRHLNSNRMGKFHNIKRLPLSNSLINTSHCKYESPYLLHQDQLKEKHLWKRVKEHRQFPIDYMINNTDKEPPIYLHESKAKLVSFLLLKMATDVTKR